MKITNSQIIKWLILIGVIVLNTLILNAQNATQKDLRDLEQRVNTKIEKIDHKALMSKETLEAAKEYSDSADKRIDRFLNQREIAIADFSNLLAIVVFIFGGGLLLGGLFIWRRVSRKLKEAEQKIQQEADSQVAKAQNELSESFQQRIANLEHQTEEDKQTLANILSTAQTAVNVKTNTKLLFIKDQNKDNVVLVNFKRTIQDYFDRGSETVEVSVFKQIIKDDNYNRFMKSNQPDELKLIIITDDLLKDFHIAETKDALTSMFDEINERKIGLVLFSSIYWDKLFPEGFDVQYKAFGNAPYSLYSNVNNLLQYMAVLKSVNRL